MTEFQRCRRCEKLKPWDLFPRNRANVATGRDRLCSACWAQAKRKNAPPLRSAPKPASLAPPPDSVSTVHVREISNVLELERGADYECYLRMDGLEPVVGHFYARYERLPDEIIVYNNYAYLKITPTEANFRKGLVFPGADISVDTAVVQPS